jgi:hypothetical protein
MRTLLAIIAALLFIAAGFLAALALIAWTS